MVKAVEASKQIVQTGTQQRSWDHFILGKQLIDSGRLGQITFVHTYWYQHARAGTYAPVSMDKLDWKAWLGPAPDQPFRPERFYPVAPLLGLRRRLHHRSDDALDRRGPLVHGRRRAGVRGRDRRNYNIKLWEAPDTVNATLEFPKNFMAAYLGTYVSRVDDGGLEFRGDLGTLKIDRARLAFYRDDAAYAPGSHAPEPEIYIRSSVDGSVAHLQNWLDCIRSRKTPTAPIRAGHAAARTSHITNAALRSGRPARWNPSTGQAHRWRRRLRRGRRQQPSLRLADATRSGTKITKITKTTKNLSIL